MNQKDINEIRKRLVKDKNNIDRIAGCCVNAEKEKVLTFQKSFFSLDEEDSLKYLDLAKKVLAGKAGNQQMEFEFPLEEEKSGGTQNLLLQLRNNSLKDEKLLDDFYTDIIETYQTAADFLILLFHDTYDIPVKASDNAVLDGSDEVYDYILCAICPITLTKPGLGMLSKEETEIQTLPRNWMIGAPETGFTFPCFTDRSTDIHTVLSFNKKSKAPHTELWNDFFHCKERQTKDQKKDAFLTAVTDAVSAETDDAEAQADEIASIQYELNQFSATQNDVGLSDDLDKTSLSDLLQNSGVSKESKKKIVESCEEIFPDGLPSAQDVVDSHLLKEANLRVERKELREQVADLNKKLKNEPSDRITVSVPREKKNEVKETMVDGQYCLVIPLVEGEQYTLV